MAFWMSVILWICAALSFTISELIDDNFLLVIDGPAGKLHQLALNSSEITAIPITDQVHPVALDYDPLRKKIFWTDVGRNARPPNIYSANLDGTDQKAILTLTPSSSPEGIAVDPKLQLVFYADNGPDTINVVLYNGTYEATVVRSAHNPRDIKLDTVKRHIYWTDWGKGTIERSNYDGSGRVIMHKTDNAWINTLDLDLQLSLMFWTNARHDVVMSASIETPLSEAKTIIDGNAVQIGSVSPHYYGIAVDKDYIYLSDWTQKTIFRADRDGSNYTAIGPNFTMLNSLHVYESARYQYGGDSPCLTNKAGCSAICLPVGDLNYTCVCPEGQELAADKHKCGMTDRSSGPDLIWLEYDGTASSYVRGVKGEPREFIRASSLQSWRIHSPMWHWKAMDFNYKDQLLYMVDGFDKYITRLTLNGTLSLQIIYYGLSSSVNGLAYDWLTNTLYWTDGFNNWIRACRAEVRTENVKTLIRTRLDSPHGIAVYPEKGLMYWTDWGEVDKIEVATLAGENRQVLISDPQPVFSPTGITIDYTNNRLYWCNQHQLMSASIDGTDIKTHYSSSSINLAGISFHDNYIIATDKGVSGSRPYVIFLNVNSPNMVPKLGLDRWPSDIIMYHKDRQPALKTNETMDCKSCSQLCVSEASFANHSRCMCRDGYRLDIDGRTCLVKDTASSPGFIYSMGNKICAIPIEDIHTKQPDAGKYCFFNSTSKYRFTALDFDFAEATIYFSEVQKSVKTIRRANLNNKENNSVIVYGVGEVYGLAYDYTAGNVYWADNTQGQIWVARSDGSYQKMLIPNRNKPRALQLNMKSKLLYWSEETADGKSQIMSSSMDGSDITVFVGTNLGNITGFTIDYMTEKLYWVDYGLQKVESIFFDGTSRTSLNQFTASKIDVYDLAIFEDFVGVTEIGFGNDSGLHALELTTGVEHTKYILPGHAAAYDVIAYDAQKHYSGNAALSCGYQNGFCEQLCLQSDSDHFVCACMDGMVVGGSDNKTCHPAKIMTDKFLLIADDYRHTIHQVDPKNPSSFTSLKLPPRERPISVTYDPKNNRIYWSDFNSGTIKRAFVNGSNVEVIKASDEDSRIDGLAFESTSQVLYYTDTNKNLIGILSPSGLYHKVLHRSDAKLSNIRAIVLDVEHGYMYYTVRGSGKAKIMKANLDSTNPIEIINTNLSWPTGLALDKTDQKLYWIDTTTEKIEFANLDGSERETRLQLNSTADPFGITIVGNTLYWTDWQHSGLFYAPKDGTAPPKVWHTEAFPGLNDLHYIDRSNLGVGSCTVAGVPNGGCSHFCIPTITVRTCACPDYKNGTAVVPGNGAHCSSPSCLTTIPNGQFDHGCKMTIGSSCHYTCNQGFGATVSTPITCIVGFQWSVSSETLCTDVSCPNLMLTPANAELDNTTRCHSISGPGAECKFKCKPGYERVGGDYVHKCLPNKTWSGSPIQCAASKKTCPILPTNPPNTQVSPTYCNTTSKLLTIYSTCTYTCDSGYYNTDGTRIRMCSIDLKWSGSPYVCSPKESSINQPTTTTPTAPATVRSTTATVRSTTATHTEGAPTVGDTGAHVDYCPILTPTPPHSIVYPSQCNSNSVHLTPGSRCSYTCMDGHIQKGGSASRRCLVNLIWTGSPIVCTPNGATTATMDSVSDEIPAIGESGMLKSESGRSVVPIIVGILVAVLVLGGIIIVVAVFMYRRGDKNYARYRDSTNYNGTRTDDLQPVVNPGDIAPSYDANTDKVHLDGSHHFNNNLYVAQNGIKQDGSVAFNNPGYATTKDIEAMNAQYSEIEYDQSDEAINTDQTVVPDQIEVKIPDSSDRTAFANPLYENVEQPGIDLGMSGTNSES